MRKLLLISNSGTPLLRHCRAEIRNFLSDVRKVSYVTAARIDDAELRFEAAAVALAEIGLAAEHLRIEDGARQNLSRAEAVFVSGGNTYVLLHRLRESGLLPYLAERVANGLPYIGTSAGTNIAGPSILATNDWNVIGTTCFDAMNLVPWVINPHYKQNDPAMAPGSESRDQRISEYLKLNATPVLAIEEGTAVRIEDGVARVAGMGRARIFQRDEEPRWLSAGSSVPLNDVRMEKTVVI